MTILVLPFDQLSQVVPLNACYVLQLFVEVLQLINCNLQFQVRACSDAHNL